MWSDDEHGEKRSRVEALWFYAQAWEQLRTFFRDVLRLKEAHVDQDETWAQFSTDAGPALYVTRALQPGQTPGVPTVGLRYSELETLHERLSAAGIVPEVRRGDAGITRLRFSDPEGHRFAAYRWEIKDAVKPVSVQGAAFDEAGRVLLVKVGRKYTLPGGVVDDAEGPLETLEREFVEEVGVRPVDARLTGAYHSIIWDGLRLVFRCRVEGEPRPGAEAEACEFVEVKRVVEMAPPWILDRVLDAIENPQGAAMYSQRTDSPDLYVSPRQRR